MCGASACGSVDYTRAIVAWAKIELLKEKVKARLNEKYGKQLDALADLVVEVVAERSQSEEGLEVREEKLAQAWDEIDG